MKEYISITISILALLSSFISFLTVFIKVACRFTKLETQLGTLEELHEKNLSQTNIKIENCETKIARHDIVLERLLVLSEQTANDIKEIKETINKK